MESAVLGFVLDSSSVIAAERNSQSVASFIEAMLQSPWLNLFMAFIVRKLLRQPSDGVSSLKSS